MSRFAVDHLSPLAVRRRLEEVDLEEKARLAEGLALIALMDARGDYLEAGFSCMQRYCMERLRMSEEQAQRRIRAARLGRAFPVVFERLADGRLTVTNACELAPVLTSENAEMLLAAAEYQPKLQVRRMVADATRAQSAKPMTTEPEPRQSSDAVAANAAPAPTLAELCGTPAPDAPLTESAPARVNSHVRGRVFETEAGAHGLRVELTDEEFAAFQQARDLLSHVVRNGDPAVVVARALAHYAAHLHRRRFGAKRAAAEVKRVPRGRHIPAALRHEVAERDGCCCAFVGADGHRCGDTRGLQFDHIVPLAQGGETTAANLRLLCAHHNRHEAAKRLGAEHVAARREQRERARALEHAAQQREAARAEARAAMPSATNAEQAPPDEPADAAESPEQARRRSDADTIAALRWMGTPPEQARLAAERTAALADGPLEARVLAAVALCGSRFGRRQDFRRPADAATTAAT
ncbi:MAG: HNH endonuclease [Candidatus Eisenbacteria bacterium]